MRNGTWVQSESDNNKKRRERFLLDRFIEHQGLTPMRIDPGEAPDFLVTLDGRTVGIEVTELFIQSSSSGVRLRPRRATLQAIESCTDLVVSKAREIYFGAKNPPVLSKILFSNQIAPMDNRKRDKIAELIANQIQWMNRPDLEVIDWRSRDDENAENPLSEWVTFIYAHKVPTLRFARWSPISAGLVSTLTASRLQEEIDKKASKMNAYKLRAEEIWLLIVADRTRISQKISVMPDFPLNSISSPFARTLYYGYPTNEVLSFEATKRQTLPPGLKPNVL